MPKMTVLQIEALKAQEKPYKKNVDTGLQIRVAANGVKTWIIRYVVAGHQRDYRLPKPWGHLTDDGHLSLKDARSEVERIRALARQGIDIQVQQEQQRQAETKAHEEAQAAMASKFALNRVENLTVRELADAWLADGVRRKDGNVELQRSLNKDVFPEIGSIAVKSVTEHDLRTLLRKMVKRGVNRSAVVVHANLTQMFLWAEKRQPWRKLLTEGNPIQLIEIDKIVSPDYDLDNQRERCLSDEEIFELQAIFKKMRHEFDGAADRRSANRPIDPKTEIAVWIMLSTICRVGELSMARWENVSLETGKWFIPRENTKGQKRHQNDLTVYLSKFALNQFRLLFELTGESDWCFPARNNDGHVCVKSISKQIGDRQSMFKKNKEGQPRQPMKNRRHDNSLVLVRGRNGDWTPHDLRRTGATLMQGLGVALDIIDRCQNHVIRGSKVRRHYLHYDYADEKKEAWRILGERLDQIFPAIDNVRLLRAS